MVFAGANFLLDKFVRLNLRYGPSSILLSFFNCIYLSMFCDAIEFKYSDVIETVMLLYSNYTGCSRNNRNLVKAQSYIMYTINW
jgi:hypothetical protein